MFKTFIHLIKNLYLRFRYGAGCCDVADLNCYLAYYLERVLIQYKKCVNSFPKQVENIEEWIKILDEIIWSLNYYHDGYYNGEFDQSKEERAQKGMELFGKYFSSL